MLNPPEFPSNYLKTREVVEGAAVPDKLAFNFFVPHETMCQSEKVRCLAWPGLARAVLCCRAVLLEGSLVYEYAAGSQAASQGGN